MMKLLLAVLLFGVVLAKKGGQKVDTSNVVDPDPEAENIVSPEYNPDLTEGDISNKEGKKNPEDRNAVKDENKLWPQGVVPYELHYSLSSHMKQKVALAMKDYEKYTCIRWQKRRGEKDYVRIKTETPGCYAYKGRSGGEQPLNLQDPGCDAKGTIIHEMLHTIGFAHEQSRGDRDRYITVNWQNIESDKHDQFKKLESYEENNQGFGYDFSSVMHYGPMGFSKNGRPAITTKSSRYQNQIGQRAGFSKQDIEEVNKLYKCRGGRSGVGGKNGCMDKDARQCADVMRQHGKQRACNARGNIPEFCAVTCGRC